MRAAAKKYVKQDTIQVTTENYMEIMEVIYDYPDEFVGKTLEFTGFVYNDPSDQKSQFLFRFGIIHCIADSGVYNLLTTGNTQHFENAEQNDKASTPLFGWLMMAVIAATLVLHKLIVFFQSVLIIGLSPQDI